MEGRLTPEQLELIVGEVGRLADRQQQELDRSQVQQILTELNLPPELLDEATIQVQRRQVLARSRQRNRNLAIAAIAALVAIGIGTSVFLHNRSTAIANVTVSQSRITLSQDRGENLQTVARGEEIVYRVRLDRAPVGERLDLTCNWIDPTGKIDRTNRYETKNITTPTWNTQCRDRLPVNAPTGKWQVEILLGDRVLNKTPFEVK